MAGIDVGGRKGGRKRLDSEINMIPMIDLLMVTISFLLLTAVWVQNSRLTAKKFCCCPRLQKEHIMIYLTRS